MSTCSPSGVEYVEVQTALDPGFSIIWLHGLGADGHDFEPVVPQLGLKPGLAARFLFPHAPMRPITCNGGIVMRGWYDITNLPGQGDWKREIDHAGLQDSERIVCELIEQENRRGVPAGNIVLAGFSQGGAVVLSAGLKLDSALAGIVALSTYIPDPEGLMAHRTPENQGTAIFMGHGTHDPLIPLSAAEHSRDALMQNGYGVSWHCYPMQHSVCPQEVQDIADFLNRVLDP